MPIDDLIQIGPQAIQQPAPTTSAPDAAAPAEQVAETKPLATPVETPTTSAPAAVEWGYKEVKERFKLPFENEDQLTSSLKKLEKFSELETKAGQVDEWKTKYESLLGEFDLKKAFVNDNEFRRQQILKKFPNEDVSVMNRLLTMDEKAASDVDVLALQQLREIPGISDEDAKLLVLQRYGVNDSEELEGLKDSDPAKYRMVNLRLKADAVKIRQDFGAMKNVDLNVTNAYEAEKQSLAEKRVKDQEELRIKSEPALSQLVNSLKELKIMKAGEKGELEEALTYALEDDSMLKDIKKEVHDQWVREGWPLNEDSVKKANQLMYTMATWQALPKILSRFEKNIRTQEADARHKLLHNDGPINTNTAERGSPLGDDVNSFIRTGGTKQGGLVLG